MLRAASSTLLALLVVACGSSHAAGPSADAGDTLDADTADASAIDADASPVDAAPDVDKAKACASTFGSALTNAFGRLDGTVVAVVPPNDQACAKPNSTHMVIQVAMGGATYRMVVDVLSSKGSPDLGFDEIDAPLAAGAWAEGWHPGVVLDYQSTLNVHSAAFTTMHQAELVAKITSEIDLGAKISVFATSSGASFEPDSAHLVHRNLQNADGAIVIRPDSAQPHWLLLRFLDQTF
jgi:hypothetical protein